MDSETYIDYLMCPPRELSDEIYDKSGFMREDLRQKLLKLCKIYEKRLLNVFPGLEITDILLIGSAASLYYGNSDFDVEILVKNNNCDYLSKRPEELFKCLELFSQNSFFKEIPAYIGCRLVNISLESRLWKYLGAYSVKNNQWICYPGDNVYKAFSKTEIIDFCYTEMNCFHKFIARLKDAKGLTRVEKAQAVLRHYEHISFLWNGSPFYVYQAWKFLKFTKQFSFMENELWGILAQLFSFNRIKKDGNDG